ncbi:MAG TPA: dihydrolipoyl dehydrogenase [Bacilli bacterium]|nr:dihydrolipoyl dehydrogenase [Bacilli bacterium]
MNTYDVLIIGGGPGGYVAAIKAAQLGMKTALIEKEAVGGVCLNWGCIPTKAMLKSAKVYDTFKHSHDYGISVDFSQVGIDYEMMIARKDGIVKKLTGGVKGLLKKNGVTVIDGFAEALDAHHVLVNGETLETKKLIIATGASPAFPPIKGLKEAFERGFVVTSKEILTKTTLPKSLIVIGGGVIGMEFATIFNTLGVNVKVLEREATPLVSVDDEIRNLFLKKIVKDGITVITGANITEITETGIICDKGGAITKIDADMILLATGMRPNTKGFEKLKLEMSKTGVKVDSLMRTSLPDVYAIGDVLGFYMLAHVASREGIVAVEHIHGIDHPLDFKVIPAGIYTFPEIAQVGLTEQEAREKELDYKVSTFPLVANGKALAENEKDGLVKIIADRQYGEIIGVHIFAASATEMITEASLAMVLEATAEEIVATIHPHPSLSEMIHEVTHGIVNKPIHI